MNFQARSRIKNVEVQKMEQPPLYRTAYRDRESEKVSCFLRNSTTGRYSFYVAAV